MSSPILITVGMGIGPELCPALIQSYRFQNHGHRRLIFLGRPEALPKVPLASLDDGPLISAIAFEDDMSLSQPQQQLLLL